MLKRLKARRPSASSAIALVALFVALGGTSYAVTRIDSNSVRSRHIVNDAVTSADIKGGGGRTGDIKNRDVNALLAVAKGFASVESRVTNGPANVFNFGGQQTRTSPAGVSAQRVATGVYDVTFSANTGTGRFVNVDSVNDLTWQVTGRNGFSTGSVFSNASSANTNQIKLRVFMRNPSTGNPIDSSFSVQFYARTTG
ncbi:MAG: hypothetical protein M3433_05625 [Actinomycetota bacterium]|nr:hypothetical protein [Actinomycetota bacterium]